MTRKKVTLLEAEKESGNSEMRVNIVLDKLAQMLFEGRPDKRVTFPMLVASSAKKANAGEWKGDVDDGKFAISITESRARTLLEEVTERVQNQPVSVKGAVGRLGGIKGYMLFLVRNYGRYVNFDEPKQIFDEAVGEFEDLVDADVERGIADFRETVDKAQHAANMACDLTNRNLELHLREVMERVGLEQMHDLIIGKLSSDRRDRFDEIHARLKQFSGYSKPKRSNISHPGQKQELARDMDDVQSVEPSTSHLKKQKPVRNRDGVQSVSDADVAGKFSL